MLESWPSFGASGFPPPEWRHSCRGFPLTPGIPLPLFSVEFILGVFHRKREGLGKRLGKSLVNHLCNRLLRDLRTARALNCRGRWNTERGKCEQGPS